MVAERYGLRENERRVLLEETLLKLLETGNEGCIASFSLND
jgi:hypothetical protein